MCCQVRVRPVNKAIGESVLETGQFVKTTNESEWSWVRTIPEEGTSVLAKIDSDSFMLTLRPGVHTMYDHAGKRIAASVMFEIAWRYAEKINGEVWQIANIQQCREDHGEQALIGHYGIKPFCWEDICLGFRKIILGTDNN